MNSSKHQFGTFSGVFTPAILTILGVIMFMRANFVVGQAGLIGSILILLLAKSITLTTSLSIGAISTNMPVKGGGAYFLISRVLGAEYGGAIGIALFFALALSVPFYILGFTEALVLSFPTLTPHFQTITFTSAAVLFFIAFYGAGLAIRTQFFIMAFLFLAVFMFLTGSITHFSYDTLLANLGPAYTQVSSNSSESGLYSYWIIFAIYFPAVTGIDAGLNMSGDLEDPAKSIPHGTLSAVFLGFLIYLVQMILSAGAFQREQLIHQPFETLRDSALFGGSIFVILGVIAATLSSALGSYLGAPRVLQAVSRDRVLFFLRYFAKGTPKGDEPRRALFLTLFITFSVLCWAGNKPGGAALNGVASIITMFFLYSYGMINLAAFTEGFGHNPSFRPRFRFFHWSIALLGAVGCIGVSVLINWLAAFVAVILIFILFWFLKTRHLQAAFGDARRGFVYRSVRDKLLTLQSMQEDPKNWRPNLLVFSGIPESRENFVRFATWLEARRGLVYLANILIGNIEELASRRTSAVKQISKFCKDKKIDAFPVVVVSEDLPSAFHTILQSTVLGPIQPNLIALGWSDNTERLSEHISILRHAAILDKNIILYHENKFALPIEKRIDVWWRGQENGGLMLLLTYLLTTNWEWEGATVRVLRVVTHDAGRDPALGALEELVSRARVEATAKVIVSHESFLNTFERHSKDASCVFLGMNIPEPDSEMDWYRQYKSFVNVVPSVVLVNSRGAEGLLP